MGILQLDLSQIEWRGAAWLSQDAVMMHEINSGVDQHNAACTDLMELELTKENRFFAKIFNISMVSFLCGMKSQLTRDSQIIGKNIK